MQRIYYTESIDYQTKIFKETYQKHPSFSIKPIIYSEKINFQDSIKCWNLNKRKVNSSYTYHCSHYSSKKKRYCLKKPLSCSPMCYYHNLLDFSHFNISPETLSAD